MNVIIVIFAMLASLMAGVEVTIPPCASEDTEQATPCYWDAPTRGNGQGDSFIWTGSATIYTTK